MTASFVACVNESVDKARRVPWVVHKGLFQEKRPRVRAFGKGAGPEFEGSTRSGCCPCWQPLQVSRLPAGSNLSSLSCVRSVLNKPESGKPKMAICSARLDSIPAERAVRHSPKVRP